MVVSILKLTTTLYIFVYFVEMLVWKRKKGIYTKVIETARNLINLGISRKNIVLATGLSMKEIEQL